MSVHVCVGQCVCGVWHRACPSVCVRVCVGQCECVVYGIVRVRLCVRVWVNVSALACGVCRSTLRVVKLNQCKHISVDCLRALANNCPRYASLFMNLLSQLKRLKPPFLQIVPTA